MFENYQYRPASWGVSQTLPHRRRRRSSCWMDHSASWTWWTRSSRWIRQNGLQTCPPCKMILATTPRRGRATSRASRQRPRSCSRRKVGAASRWSVETAGDRRPSGVDDLRASSRRQGNRNIPLPPCKGWTRCSKRCSGDTIPLGNLKLGRLASRAGATRPGAHSSFKMDNLLFLPGDQPVQGHGWRRPQ